MAVREISTSIKLDGEQAFNDQMKALNNNTKNLRSEMSALSAEFASNAGSVEALTAKQAVQQEIVDQQAEKVRALEQAYSEVAEANGEASAEADRYRQQLNSARAALAKQEAELNKLTTALDAAKNAEKSYTPITERAADAVTKAKDKIKEFAAGVADAAQHTPVLGEALDVIGAAGKVAGNGLEVAGTAAKGAVKGATALVTAGAAATAALGTFAVAGIKKLSDYAKEAAENGDPAFANLATNLEALNSASAAAKSALGGVLLPALESLSSDGAEFLNDFSRDMAAAEGDTAKMGEVMGQYIARGAELVRARLPEMLELGGNILQALTGGVIDNLPEILGTAQEIMQTLLNGIIANSGDLGDAAVQIIMSFGEFLLENAPNLLVAGVELFANILEGLSSALPQLIPLAGQLIVELVTSLGENAPQLIMSGLSLLLALVQGIVSAIPQLVQSIPQIITAIKDAFTASWPEIKTIGLNLIHGLWDGISGAMDWLYEKVVGFGSSVMGWFKGIFGIASPSKVMRDEVGRWMALGLAEGFDAEMGNVNRRINGAIQTHFDVDTNIRGLERAAGRQVSTVINIYPQKLDDATMDYIYNRFSVRMGADA